LIAQSLPRLLVSVLPVLIFLLALIFLDSYKLVKFRTVLLTVAVGFAAGFVCILINRSLFDVVGLDRGGFARYVAPPIEEFVKGAYIVFLIRSRRVGFMVDAAICGFAVGAGFAILENVELLGSLPNSNIFLWVVRGFGTAVMHGGSTALFGIIGKTLHDRYCAEDERRGTAGRGASHCAAGVLSFLPGYVIAVLIHSLYNHFLISPELSAIGIVIVLPALMVLVFQQSERVLRNWLGVGFDTEAQLYEMLTTGRTTETHVGQYLMSLKTRFPAEVVADMLCLLQVHLELSIRAKGMLLMRESGYEAPPDPDIKEKFAELRYLEKSVGQTGRFAIMPFLRWSSRDLWQLYMLGKK
jgi:protease PrsW